MQNKKILIVDDEPGFCQLLTDIFCRAGAQPYIAQSGSEGLRQLYLHQPDLVMLDIMMPNLDGWQVCAQMRQLTTTPIIFVTALGGEEQIARGLECGAVDYITKPVSSNILLARVRAALRYRGRRRPPGQEKSAVYKRDDLIVDLDKRQVFSQGQLVKLTPTEYKLLTYLVENGGRALTYHQILGWVWGAEYQDSPEYVHVHMSNLRRKLEKDPKKPRYLLAEYGLGYRIAA